MIIYFDMDGVLCNFKGKIQELYGEPFKSSMWPDIAENHPHIYKDLEPFGDMVELVKTLSKSYAVRILSATPSMVHMPYCGWDKVYWVHKHFGLIYGEVVNRAFDKQFRSDYNSVLVDDSNINIEQWVARGGIGIRHTSFSKTKATLERLLEN